MRNQANRSRGEEAIPVLSSYETDIGLWSLTKAPVSSASSTHTQTPMPFRRGRCARFSTCGNSIGVQMPRAQAGNGHFFVTRFSNDPSSYDSTTAMLTIERFVLDVRQNSLLGADPNKPRARLRHTIMLTEASSR